MIFSVYREFVNILSTSAESTKYLLFAMANWGFMLRIHAYYTASDFLRSYVIDRLGENQQSRKVAQNAGDKSVSISNYLN